MKEATTATTEAWPPEEPAQSAGGVRFEVGVDRLIHPVHCVVVLHDRSHPWKRQLGRNWRSVITGPGTVV